MLVGKRQRKIDKVLVLELPNVFNDVHYRLVIKADDQAPFLICSIYCYLFERNLSLYYFQKSNMQQPQQLYDSLQSTRITEAEDMMTTMPITISPIGMSSSASSTAASTSVASENISEEKAKKGLPPLVAALPKQILKVLVLNEYTEFAHKG